MCQPLDVLLGAWSPQAPAILAEYSEALDAVEPNADEMVLSARVLNLACRRHGLSDPTAETDLSRRATLPGASGVVVWPVAGA